MTQGTPMPSRRALLGAAGMAGAMMAPDLAVGSAASPQPTGAMSGKAVLITGAARGIGRATAEAFAREGAAVALVDIADPSAYRTARGYRVATAEELDEAVASVRSLGGRALRIVADVRQADAMQQAVAQTLEAFGRLDVAIANAGLVIWHPFEDGTPEQWRDVFDTNVHGVFNTFHAALPAMKAQEGGRLLATTSVAGRAGFVGNGAYNASKWSVIGLVKQAALELGKYGIAVNAVAPGPVDTPMYNSEGQRRSMGVETVEAQNALMARMLPYGGRPMQDPSEIADAFVFLASDQARGISGAVLDVALGFNANYTA